MAKQQKPSKVINPLIGFGLWWYPRADRRETPRAAICTGPAYEHRDGLLTLHVFEEFGDRARIYRNVRPMDHPAFKTAPRLKEAGGWELAPSAKLRRGYEVTKTAQPE